jgi:hypothetical protein
MTDPFQPSNRRVLVIDDNPALHDDFHPIPGSTQPRQGHLDALEAELFGEVVRLAPVGLVRSASAQRHLGLR